MWQLFQNRLADSLESLFKTVASVHLYDCAKWQAEYKVCVKMQIFKDSKDNLEEKDGRRATLFGVKTSCNST